MTSQRHRLGQAALEYLLVFLALFAIVSALGWFVRVSRAAAERTATLIGSESA